MSAAAKLDGGATNHVAYYALSYNATLGTFVEPNAPDGYMRVSSLWVFET